MSFFLDPLSESPYSCVPGKEGTNWEQLGEAAMETRFAPAERENIQQVKQENLQVTDTLEMFKSIVDLMPLNFVVVNESRQTFGVKSTVDFYKILPKVKRRLDPYILCHPEQCL
jgi:hypothetical protein